MLFNSYIFVFIFLPVTICGYFFLNFKNKTQSALIFLAGMSLWFYGYFNYKYLFIIIGSILFNHGYAISIRKFNNYKAAKKIIFSIVLIFNIGLIFYYKYYDFFVTNTNKFFHTTFTLQNIILPLGISFFTIQQISYVIDVYRGKAERVSFIEYTVYVTFFPQLIAGPIVRYDELIPQLKDRRLKTFHWDNFTRGIYGFVLGMSKKVLIADMFGRVANYGFTNYTTLNSASLFFACFSYTIQIYFDFSGYSDMAIGLGKMLNFSLPINFYSPYKALTISEFWNRWHLTLTRFLREYVYFPLGGNKKGICRTYLNIFFVFLISGIWHGANWTFILWGGGAWNCNDSPAGI